MLNLLDGWTALYKECWYGAISSSLWGDNWKLFSLMYSEIFFACFLSAKYNSQTNIQLKITVKQKALRH